MDPELPSGELDDGHAAVEVTASIFDWIFLNVDVGSKV